MFAAMADAIAMTGILGLTFLLALALCRMCLAWVLLFVPARRVRPLAPRREWKRAA